MIELKDELYAAPVYTLQTVPITANRHKWWLRWYRGDDGEFYFGFVSPQKRCYSFFAERWTAGSARGTDASVTIAHGDTIASYRDVCGNSPERMDAVIRLTPKHIIDRLSTLLDAIG